MQMQPAAEPPFSKGQVNRAGKLLLSVAEAASGLSASRAATELNAEEVIMAFRALTWWRTLHARPLSNVAANLRYHVDKEDGRRIGVGLKFGAGTTDIHAYYLAVSDAFAFLDRGETIPAELVAALSERYAKIRGTLSRGEQTTP